MVEDPFVTEPEVDLCWLELGVCVGLLVVSELVCELDSGIWLVDLPNQEMGDVRSSLARTTRESISGKKLGHGHAAVNVESNTRKVA